MYPWLELDRRFDFEGQKIRGWGVAIIIMVVIIALVIFQSIGRVGIGYVAVIVDPFLGRTTAVGEGANARYFMKLLWATVKEVYVATHSINMWSDMQAVRAP